MSQHGLSRDQIPVACDAGIAQACKPAEGFGTIARFSIPKIEACPAPFRA